MSKPKRSADECWIPKALRADRVRALCEAQELKDCKKYVESCCGNLLQTLRFPHRIPIILDPSMHCGLETLTEHTRLQFEMAGYDVNVQSTSTNTVVVVNLKRDKTAVATPEDGSDTATSDDASVTPKKKKAKARHHF